MSGRRVHPYRSARGSGTFDVRNRMHLRATLLFLIGCAHPYQGPDAQAPEPAAAAARAKTPPDESDRQPWSRTDPKYFEWRDGRWATKVAGRVHVNPRPVWTPEGWSLDEGGWLPDRPTYRLEQGSYECRDGQHKWLPATWYPDEWPREAHHTPPAIFMQERPAPGRLELSINQPGVLQQLQLVNGSLVWRASGATWMMRGDGTGCIASVNDGLQRDRESSDIKAAFVMVGGRLHALTRHAIVRYGAAASGPHDRIAIAALPDDPVVVVSDGTFLYTQLFASDTIMRVPLAGGDASVLAELPRGAGKLGVVLAIHDGVIYAASYTTGDLVAIPTTGGATRSIAHALPGPRALAVDASGVYVLYQRAKPNGSELEGQLRRIDPKTGASQVLATNLFNGGHVTLDGPFAYVPSRSTAYGDDVEHNGKLYKVAKDGSSPPQILLEGMQDLGPILVDDHAIIVQVVDRYSRTRFIRLDKP